MKSFAKAALLVLLNAAIAGAQSTSGSSGLPSNGAPFGKIEGIVFDSLLMRPLAGANVWIAGTTHSALTDARGHFAFDSVTPGHQLIAFSSSGLDSAGLGDLTDNADVTAGKTTELKLASPSRRRLWSILCGARTKIGADSGIAFGMVQDGETNARLVQAPVTFSWYNLNVRQGLGDVSNKVFTDSNGAYYACGLPIGVQLASEAFGNKARSGAIEYQIGERGLFHIDIVASTEMTVGNTMRGTAIVRGVVVNERSAPVADALVSLSGSDTTVRSERDGSFVFQGVRSGSLALRVQRVGSANASRIVNVRRGENVQTTVVLSSATNLATVNVAGVRSTKSPEMQDLEARQKMGFGTLFNFVKDEPANSLAPLMTVPRVRVTYPRGGVPSISMTVDGGQRTCIADVYLDGRLSDVETISTYPLNLLAALEVYSSPFQVPAQYMRGATQKQDPASSAPIRNPASVSNRKAVGSSKDPLSGSCGAVLYWTKGVLRP